MDIVQGAPIADKTSVDGETAAYGASAGAALVGVGVMPLLPDASTAENDTDDEVNEAFGLSVSELGLDGGDHSQADWMQLKQQLCG